MKNKTIIPIVITILVIVGGFILLRKSNNTLPLPVSDNSSVGCYVATLSKDTYTLIIQSEKDGAISGMLAYNNAQKDSSSGAFSGTYTDGILSGVYSFDSEGMHSDSPLVFKKVGDDFVQGFGPTKIVDGKEVIDPASVTFDPKSTFVKSSDCIKHFVEANNTFSFDHNAFFQSFETELIPGLDWRLDATQNGVVLATLIIPRTYEIGTNFSDARLTVGRSSDPAAIQSCTSIPVGGKDDGSKNISGYPFKKFETNGAGAGNFYETTSYAGIFDGDCYVIEYTIHSTNIGNYPPEQGIKEFDKTKIQNELEKVISSFKFLVSSN